MEGLGCLMKDGEAMALQGSVLSIGRQDYRSGVESTASIDETYTCFHGLEVRLPPPKAFHSRSSRIPTLRILGGLGVVLGEPTLSADGILSVAGT